MLNEESKDEDLLPDSKLPPKPSRCARACSCLNRVIKVFPTFWYVFGQELYYKEGKVQRNIFKMRGLFSLVFLLILVAGFTTVIFYDLRRIGLDVAREFHVDPKYNFRGNITVDSKLAESMMSRLQFKPNAKDWLDPIIEQYQLDKKRPYSYNLCYFLAQLQQKRVIDYSGDSVNCSMRPQCYYNPDSTGSDPIEIYLGYYDQYPEVPEPYEVYSWIFIEKIEESFGYQTCDDHFDFYDSRWNVTGSKADDTNQYFYLYIAEDVLPYVEEGETFIPGPHMNVGVQSRLFTYNATNMKEENSTFLVSPTFPTTVVNEHYSFPNSFGQYDFPFLDWIFTTMFTIPKVIEQFNSQIPNLLVVRPTTLHVRTRFYLSIEYPPSKCIERYFYSFSDFLVTIGGYFSLLKTFVGLLVGLFIFRELNKFMGRRLVSQLDNADQIPENRRVLEEKKMAKLFRKRVSQEEIFYLHDKVERLQEENKVLKAASEKSQKINEELKNQLETLADEVAELRRLNNL